MIKMKTIKSLTEAEIAELPKLPDEWKWARIGEIHILKSDKYKGSGESLFYVGLEHINKDKGTLTEDVKVDEINTVKNSFKKGDLLYGKLRPYLNKVYLANEDGVCSTDILVFESTPSLNLNYSKYFFLSYKFVNDMTQNSSGVNLPRVSTKYLQEYPFPIAPLPEQRAIVTKIDLLFSELDNGIANLKLAQEQLKVYRQAVLKKAFEGELTKKWREQQTDLPDEGDLLEQIRKEREEAAKSAGKNVKNIKPPTEMELAKLPIMPKEWMWVKLDYLGDLGRGKSKHRPRNDKILFGGKYPFIQTGEVKAANHTIKSFEKTYSDFGLAQSKLWPKGTLCITIAANIAETAFLGFEGCFPDSIVGFTAIENLVVKEYVYYFFMGNQSKIEAFAPATAQKNINLNILENLLIPFCSLPEQQTIVQEIETRLSVCDKIEQDIETNLEKAEALRQSILKKAYEGKLLNEKELAEVRGAEDWQPAEVLLERIKAERAKTERSDKT